MFSTKISGFNDNLKQFNENIETTPRILAVLLLAGAGLCVQPHKATLNLELGCKPTPGWKRGKPFDTCFILILFIVCSWVGNGYITVLWVKVKDKLRNWALSISYLGPQDETEALCLSTGLLSYLSSEPAFWPLINNLMKKYGYLEKRNIWLTIKIKFNDEMWGSATTYTK